MIKISIFKRVLYSFVYWVLWTILRYWKEESEEQAKISETKLSEVMLGGGMHCCGILDTGVKTRPLTLTSVHALY